MMPFRIPASFRGLSVNVTDPSNQQLREYIDWLQSELHTAKAALQAMEEEVEAEDAD